jgi:uncharacterized protein YbcV (DUF1398 family)
MAIADEIKSAYESSRTYPEIAEKLVDAGVLSYTVDVPTGITLYRLENGSLHLHTTTNEPREIAANFDRELAIQAIRDNQQGKTDYIGFITGIANAGVRFYEATLNGSSKRVTYIGIGGFYEEIIPI